MLIMREKIIQNIKDYNLINYGELILIGFSGGMDSAALLYSLLEIREEFNLTIAICHLNHGVRGEEADRDEEFSRKTAEKLGIYFESEKTDMHGFAEKEKISKEEAGRKLRQDFFNRVSKKINADKIALAHNYNDQVETLLMRILRGTGLDGLKGIDYKNENIIRPLLNVTREEIENYILENKFPYVEDSTNMESNYHRNKIRNLLLPMLRKEYNPNLEQSIFNLSELAKLDVEFLEELTKKAFVDVSKVSNDKIKIDIDKFNLLNPALQNRVIRKAFSLFPNGLKDLSLKNINEVLELKELDSGKFIDNINGCKIRNSYGKLIFEKKDNNENKDIYFLLEMGINEIHGKSIVVERVREKTSSINSITIPQNLIKNKLVLRNRRNGDRIRPIGLSGSKKLKDIFIDKKIDREIRDDYLLVSDFEKIFWVIDLVKSEITNFESSNGDYIKITINNLEDWSA